VQPQTKDMYEKRREIGNYTKTKYMEFGDDGKEYFI